MARKLTLVDKVKIITKLEDGYTIRGVAADLQLNKCTILNVKRKWETEGNLNRKRGTGLSRISTPEQDRLLVQYLRENPFKVVRNAIIETHFPGSRQTANRRVKESELRYRVAAKKIKLSEEHKQTRLLYALNHINYGPEFWETVIFSDEKNFQSANNKLAHVYRPRNTRFEERYVNNNDRQGRFSINVWAWINYHGNGMCWKIDDRLTSRNYVHMLENIMLPSVLQIFPENNFVFQQDNCPIHTARIVSEWFQQNNVEVLQWVPKSADLNPIENVWAEMVKRMTMAQFRTRDDLWDLIENTWEDLMEQQGYVRNLILSMPRRLQAVIDANGGIIKY